MALDDRLRAGLVLPAICAPMFLVSGPELVTASCKAGVVGSLPRQNARGIDVFEGWLREIRSELDEFAERNPNARVGPLAVNLATNLDDVVGGLGPAIAICGVAPLLAAAFVMPWLPEPADRELDDVSPSEV